jgi:hypothetical protein
VRKFINWLICGGVAGMVNALLLGLCWLLSDRMMNIVGKLFIWKDSPNISLIIGSSLLCGLGFSSLFVLFHKSILLPSPFRGVVLGIILWFGFALSGFVYSKGIMLIPEIYLFNVIFISFISMIFMGISCEIIYSYLLGGAD